MELISQHIDIPPGKRLSKKERKKLKKSLKRTWKRIGVGKFVRTARHACWKQPDLEISKRAFLEEHGCLCVSIDVKGLQENQSSNNIFLLSLSASRICIRLSFADHCVIGEFDLKEMGGKEKFWDSAGKFLADNMEKIHPR